MRCCWAARSPSARTRERFNYYLANGTRLVWLVYPEKRLVIVLMSNSEDSLTENDMLTGGEVLPGFEVSVARIFANQCL